MGESESEFLICGRCGGVHPSQSHATDRARAFGLPDGAMLEVDGTPKKRLSHAAGWALLLAFAVIAIALMYAGATAR